MPTLTPVQRALLQFIWHLLLSAALAGIVAAATLAIDLLNQGYVDWRLVAVVFLATCGAALLREIAVALKPTEPTLSALIEELVKVLESRYPILNAPPPTAIPQRASLGIPPGYSVKPTAQSWPQTPPEPGPGASTGG
jgi:hypothetical protein